MERNYVTVTLCFQKNKQTTAWVSTTMSKTQTVDSFGPICECKHYISTKTSLYSATTYANNVALPRARRTARDRYLLLAGPTAANLQQRVCCCGPMLEQTD